MGPESRTRPTLSIARSVCALLLLFRLRVYSLGSILFQLLNRLGIQSKQVREFRKIDTFGTAWLFVASHDAEGKHVQRRSLSVVRYTCDDVSQRSRLRQFLLDDAVHAGLPGMLEDCRTLLLTDRTIGVGG